MRRSWKTLALLVATVLGLGTIYPACDRSGAEGSAESAERARATADDLATVEYDVEGMTCGGCALATEMAVKKLDGVESADASYDETTGHGRCTVEYDPSVVDTDEIAAAIEKAGFTPTLRSRS